MPNSLGTISTHLAGVVGARVLEVALLLGVDPVARLVGVLVGAIEVDLLLLPDDGNLVSLGPSLDHTDQQYNCYGESLQPN